MNKKIIAFYFVMAVVLICQEKSIAQQKLFINPFGGETIGQGQPCVISWKIHSPNEFFNISLWDGKLGNWIPIAKNIPSDKLQYTWYVPQNLSGDRFRIRLDYRSTGKYEMTPTYFSIGSKPNLFISDKNNYQEKSLRVFPNPSKETINVSWYGEAQSVKLWNLLGIEMLSKELNANRQSFTIETYGLASGSYLLELLFIDGHIEKENIIIK